MKLLDVFELLFGSPPKLTTGNKVLLVIAIWMAISIVIFAVVVILARDSPSNKNEVVSSEPLLMPDDSNTVGTPGNDTGPNEHNKDFVEETIEYRETIIKRKFKKG